MFELAKERTEMKRFVTSVLFAHLAVLCAASVVQAADAPAERVIAMYFHRTERCPTCQRMGGWSDEAVKAGFADQIKAGQVAFYDVDFQASQNARMVKAYHITGPALIVAKIADNKVTSHRNLEDIWLKVRDKEAFFRYVQENVGALLAH
jgi:hypothetical protein